MYLAVGEAVHVEERLFVPRVRQIFALVVPADDQGRYPRLYSYREMLEGDLCGVMDALRGERIAGAFARHVSPFHQGLEMIAKLIAFDARGFELGIAERFVLDELFQDMFLNDMHFHPVRNRTRTPNGSRLF